MNVKNHTARQIIAISKKKPLGSFTQAVEIARVFHDEKLVYVPQGEFFLGFLKMIAAIWCGGYIAGVQAERDRCNSSAPDTKAS